MGWHTASGAGGQTDTCLGSLCAPQMSSTSGNMGYEGSAALVQTHWGQALNPVLVTQFCVGQAVYRGTVLTRLTGGTQELQDGGAQC